MKQDLQPILDVLNSVLKNPIDLMAMHTLIEHRVPCSQELIDHPLVVCSGTDEKPLVGFLGILNAVVEKVTGERVAVKYDEHSGEFPVEFIRYART